MAKGTRRGQASRRRRSYIGTLALVALLTLTFVSTCLVVLLRGSLLSALSRIAADPANAPPADRELAGVALGAEVGAAVVAVTAIALAIRALRILVYTRQTHRHAEEYLARHAPLHRAGIAPLIVAFDTSGRPAPSGAAPLHRFATRSRRLLLLGASGSGKTVALHALVADVTRKRTTVRAGRRTPLPVFVALAEFARAQATSGVTLAEHVADRVERFGSPGLAARVTRLLRQGRLMLLCDELDAVPLDRRSAVCEELADIARTYPRVTVVVAYRMEGYEGHAGIRAALRPFDRAVISALDTDQIRAALRHTRISSATTRPRRGDGRSPLAGHALDVSATLPAQLAALQALASTPDLPTGRGELWRRYLDLALQLPRDEAPETHAVETETERDVPTSVLAAFAATLRATGKRYVEIMGGETVEEAVSATIADPLPLPAPGGRGMDPPSVSDGQMRAICQMSLKTGILITSDDGAAVGFSNGLVEAACAAWWLALADDGFGALPPELLRPEWHLPLLLWSGAAGPTAADLAKRALRLADTPDAVALRAELSAPDDAVPMTLAVALAVLVEGSVALLARESGENRDRASVSAVQLVNDHLRDVLDLAQIYVAQPESAARLAEMLRAVDRNSSAECAANLVRLASMSGVTRLVRSQVVTLLGLLATPLALEGLTDLLGEMDAVIRQGVNQAFVSAGAAALPYLERASRHGTGKTRGRAAEVLTMIGGGAASSAVALLGSEDGHQRALAAATLGTLRAQSAERPLIERLDDASPEVRVAAARALGRLATAAGLEAVAARAKSDDAGIRVAAAEALGLGQGTEYVPVLLPLLSDPAAAVRAAAATSLGLLGDERALAPLEGARDDADAWVRNAAEIALRRLGRMV